MEQPIKPSGVRETLDTQKKAKKAAYLLLAYLVIVTVAAIWLAIKLVKVGSLCIVAQ